MNEYLAATDTIDWQQPDVLRLAHRLAHGAVDGNEVAKRCFEWVRDEIQHTMDFARVEVTCRASDVLAAGTGFCYAKSHLLAALLRANGIPAALCYQRLSIGGKGEPFCLHGLNAVHLPEYGWYRIDARGNKPGVDAQFTPPVERLAFATQLPGEADVPGIYPEPLQSVLEALGQYDNAKTLMSNLPDFSLTRDEPRQLSKSAGMSA